MEKWFHSRFGDERFGLVDGRVGIWDFDDFVFGDWGRAAPGRKKLGNFDWGKRFAKCTVGRQLQGGVLGLAKGKLTLGRMRTAQPFNPNPVGAQQY
jgi:hypothetical protein